VNHLEIKRLKVQLIFNENVIKLKDNKKYIKEVVDAVLMLYAK